jgi:hypothetical protein
MALSTDLDAIFNAIAHNDKLAKQAIGLLVNLNTTAKGSLVDAINEVRANIETSTGLINDSTPSTNKTFSSNEVVVRLNALRDSIMGTNASEALNSFKELQDYLSADTTAFTALVTQVGNKVRFDAPQSLTNDQKTQARSNIGAYGFEEIGDPNTDFLSAYNAILNA